MGCIVAEDCIIGENVSNENPRLELLLEGYIYVILSYGPRYSEDLSGIDGPGSFVQRRQIGNYTEFLVLDTEKKGKMVKVFYEGVISPSARGHNVRIFSSVIKKDDGSEIRRICVHDSTDRISYR